MASLETLSANDRLALLLLAAGYPAQFSNGHIEAPNDPEFKCPHCQAEGPTAAEMLEKELG